MSTLHTLKRPAPSNASRFVTENLSGESANEKLPRHRRRRH